MHFSSAAGRRASVRSSQINSWYGLPCPASPPTKPAQWTAPVDARAPMAMRPMRYQPRYEPHLAHAGGFTGSAHGEHFCVNAVVATSIAGSTRGIH